MQECIRASTKLVELSRKENALTEAECDTIVSLAQDLMRQFGPGRPQHDAPNAPSALVHQAAFSADWEVP